MIFGINAASGLSSAPVSALRPAVLTPAGNADTITNALAPFPSKGARDLIYKTAQTGFFTYDEPSCRGIGSSGSPGYGEVLAKSALKSIPVVGGFLSTIAGVFGAHHAQAVKVEQATLCSEVPAFNEFLRTVDVAVSQGADTGAALQTLENGYSTFVSRLKGIFKQCNAACVYEKAARAAIEKRKQDYALVSAQNARVATTSGVISAIATTYAPAPSPNLGKPAISAPYSIDPNAPDFRAAGGTIQYGSPTPAPSPFSSPAVNGIAQASIAGTPQMQVGLLVVGVLVSGILLLSILRRERT